MTTRKDCTFALVLLLVSLDMLQALDLAEIDDRQRGNPVDLSQVSDDNEVQARSSWQSSWFQKLFPVSYSWLLQKLLDDSFEFLAFGCCVCWVCSHTSHKVFSDRASSGELDSREVLWEVLPFFMLVVGSVVLLLIIGTASWDVPAQLFLLLPVVCVAFRHRHCPILLQWLLCAGLFLQLLHHGVEHVQTHREKGIAAVDCRVSNLTKNSLRMMTDPNGFLEANVSMPIEHTMHPGTFTTYQDKEIASLKSTVNIQTQRIQDLTSEKENEETYEEKDVSVLQSTVNVQASRIQALTAEISMLQAEKEILNKTIEKLSDRNEFLEHRHIIR